MIIKAQYTPRPPYSAHMIHSPLYKRIIDTERRQRNTHYVTKKLAQCILYTTLAENMTDLDTIATRLDTLFKHDNQAQLTHVYQLLSHGQGRETKELVYKKLHRQDITTQSVP